MQQHALANPVLPDRLAECIAIAHIPLTQPQQAQLLDILDENIKHPATAVRDAAAAAMGEFVAAYMPLASPGMPAA